MDAPSLRKGGRGRHFTQISPVPSRLPAAQTKQEEVTTMVEKANVTDGPMVGGSSGDPQTSCPNCGEPRSGPGKCPVCGAD